MKKKTHTPQVLVSVLLPIYNAESFLSKTIDSVLSQSFKNFELLALDDGSTDSSKNIVLSYKDDRIKYIYCKHDFVNTCNKGLKLSKGKYIALIDHDDIMMPYRLDIQYRFMEEHPKIDACGGYMQSFGKKNTQMEVPIKHHDIIERMLLKSIMLNPTGFIRKTVLIENKIKYSKGYSFAADYKIWLDIVKVGTVENIPMVLTKYRTSDKQASIVYRKECIPADLKIKEELLNFFFSNLKENDKDSNMINDELIPMINKLVKFDIFSQDTLFPFMYEIISYYRMKGVIQV